MVSILLGTDNQRIGFYMKKKINSQPDMRVIYKTKNKQTILKLIREKPVDMILLDFNTALDVTVNLIKRIVSYNPHLKILLLLDNQNKSWMLRLLSAGASGVIIKNSDKCHIIELIRSIHHCDIYLFPNFSVSRSTSKKIDCPCLSEREIEVLSLVAAGYTNKEIADQLCISHKTVESHRANIMTKLKIKKRADLVRYAIKHGYFKLIDVI